MQIKTISKNISTKMDEWISSIKDKKLATDVHKQILVTGGSICSMLLNEDVNDYDIYLMDHDVLIRLVQYYISGYPQISIMDGKKKESYVTDIESRYEGHVDSMKITITSIKQINSAEAIAIRNLKEDQIKLFTKFGGIKVNEDKKPEELNYQPLYFSPNAISLSNKIQIVIRFHGNAETIHKTFDFIHATNYWTKELGLVRNLPAMESILTKQLKYQGSLYPVTSVIRAKKFVKRLWNINAGELLKIIFQISQLELTDPDTLAEQLIGIDVVYFELLIAALRVKVEGTPGFKPTNEYISTLIDKIFNEDDSVQFTPENSSSALEETASENYEGAEVDEPLMWWGYKHTSGTIHAKRYFDKRDIEEARSSDFVEELVPPFPADTQEEAIEYISKHTN